MLISKKVRFVMAHIGIMKSFNKLGRIVIPKDICRKLHLTPGSPVLFSVENGRVVVTPEETVCALCGDKVMDGNRLRLCKSCMAKAKQYYENQEVC